MLETLAEEAIDEPVGSLLAEFFDVEFELLPDEEEELDEPLEEELLEEELEESSEASSAESSASSLEDSP